MGREWVGGEWRSNKEYFEERSCGSKRRFADKAEASGVRRAMSQRLKIYFCQVCKGYHIGHHDDRDTRQFEKIRKRVKRFRKAKRE